MKRKLSIVLTIVMALTVLSVAPASAKAPGTVDRTGDLALLLNFGAFAPEGPYEGIVWYGTVEFDDVEYGIVYRTVTTHANEVASHWTETWEMYRPGEYAFVVDTGVLTGFVTTGAPVVSGFDKGMTHWKNFTWVGNGWVDVAEAPFNEWEGRRVHTKGAFDPVLGTGTGTIRFN